MIDTVSKTSWRNQDALLLENETIRIIVVPHIGAKLVSLFDKRSGREWLVDSGDRPLKPIPYGASFVEQDMSGWDEMFPTIVPCSYPAPGTRSGVHLPDHGEVWALPWTIEAATSRALQLSVDGVALPYRLTRTLSFIAHDGLEMHYKVVNLGEEPMPYIWAAHPQFVCSEGAEIRFPPAIREVCNTIPAEWGWGEPESRFDWPEAINPRGRRVRLDQVGPPSLQQGRKFFTLPDARPGWAGLIRQPHADWLRLEWDPERVPYLSVWVDEGALSHESVVALEPTTGFYDSLEVAWNKGLVTILEPGETQTWTLRVRLGTGEQPFPPDS
ncbi:MAG: DUF5107 domain-containing protein [Chloroflexi bacterium]|nr:MAG: DUF5107 domain-containing protein [Chloroflexota bacterium]